jgi:hypothetical protein
MFKDFLNSAANAARAAAGTAKTLDMAPLLLGTQVPSSDVYQSMANIVQSVWTPGAVRFGTIQECIPYCRSYRVAPEGGGPI